MFRGIYTPVVTPFNEKEEVDYGKMKHNLDKWAKTRLDGIVVLGSNGEFVYLSKEEKLELARFVIENFTKDKKVIVGASAESTRETIKLCKEFAQIGADAVLILPPNYFKGGMKEEVLHRYFSDVADESPVPVMLYNMPGNTGINLSSKLIASLSKHPNIVGIKDTSGNIVQLTEIVRDTEEDFVVFAGNAGYLLPALAVGARGATLALANILPDGCCDLVDLFNEGKLEAAKELQKKLLEVNFTVTGRFGVPALKHALDLLGYEGGLPRRPLLPLSQEKKEIVEEALRDCGAL